jgi:hypothetical protein
MKQDFWPNIRLLAITLPAELGFRFMKCMLKGDFGFGAKGVRNGVSGCLVWGRSRPLRNRNSYFGGAYEELNR